mmetsp:Transcript_20784/g.47184  ORF Transcript_20784/g.47184 Transcript_20784/m.47184 type:complete len:87 (+) Transcript_20784:163-423(+)
MKSDDSSCAVEIKDLHFMQYPRKLDLNFPRSFPLLYVQSFPSIGSPGCDFLLHLLSPLTTLSPLFFPSHHPDPTQRLLAVPALKYW